MGKLQSYMDFKGGLNDTSSPESLQDNELIQADNIDLSERGGFATRKGTAKLNPVSFGADVTQAFEWLVKGNSKIIAVINKRVCEILSDGKKVEKQSVQSDRIGYIAIKEWLYFCDGNKLYQWEGNTITPIAPYDSSAKEKISLTILEKAKKNGNFVINVGGIRKEIPTGGQKEIIKLTITAKPTATDMVTVVLNSKVVFVNAYANEEINTLAEKIRAFPFEGYTTSGTGAEIIFIAREIGAKEKHYFNGGDTKATGTMAVTATGSGGTPEDIAGIIRGTAFTGWTVTGEGKGIIFEANETGTKEDFVFDSLDTAIVVEYTTLQQGKPNDCDLDPIKKCTMFVQHPKSLRVFASGNPDDPTALYFSEYNDMTYFQFQNKLHPKTPEGAVTGLTVLYNHILVSYNNSWCHLSGTDPDDMVWEQLPIPYGCVSNDSIALTPFSITFLGREGIYRISASVINQDIVMMQGKEMIRNISESKVENTIKSIKALEKAQAIFYDDKYILAYCDNETGVNNKVLVYDWNVKAFVKYTGWQVNSWIKKADGELHFASKNYLMKTNEGYSDIDTATGEKKAIHVLVKTKNYSLGLPLNKKFLQFLYLVFKQDNESKIISKIKAISDYKTKDIYDTTTSEFLIWGNSKWGSIWGYTDISEVQAEMKRIASRFQIVFEDQTIDNKIVLYGIGFEFRPLKPRGKMI
ncbi:hypothetical protein [Marinisporobacter balticus]|uniref:Uncharacterized protein n=1 Tax=Marinisporobacter balticus TaxID=2018667 RepID=A0A4R2L0Q8_9FIRM|nr:hypothetical protein [Marinisporobacter balticus]TCO79132.1 hypothetical protein EV214_103184 [Marinisporobacter balticus]